MNSAPGNQTAGSALEVFVLSLKKSIDFLKQIGLFLRREVPVRAARFLQWRFRRSSTPVAGGGSGRSIVLERELTLPVERNRLGEHYPSYFQLKFGLLRFSTRLFVDARLPAETALEFRAEARVLGAPVLNFLLEFLYRRHEKNLLTALDRKANELYLEALARRPGEEDVGIPLDEFDAPEYRPEAWAERFPSENPENFRVPFSGRGLLRRWTDGLRGDSAIEKKPSRNYYRRMTVIPMAVSEESLRELLPPTFIYPVKAEPMLYLSTALDAGRGSELPSGREERIIMTLYCPAGLMHAGDYLQGWLPLFSTWTPCLRPTIPGDPYTIGYPFQAGGLRLGLGDADRRAHWMNSYTPTRVVQARDTLPGLISYERNIFRRETTGLNIECVREQADFAVNRVYFLRRTPPLTSGSAGPRSARTAAAWFSRRLGVEVRETDHGWFLTSMISESSREIIPLHRTQFRSAGPAVPGMPERPRVVSL